MLSSASKVGFAAKASAGAVSPATPSATFRQDDPCQCSVIGMNRGMAAARDSNSPIQYSAVQYSTALHCAVLPSAEQRSAPPSTPARGASFLLLLVGGIRIADKCSVNAARRLVCFAAPKLTLGFSIWELHVCGGRSNMREAHGGERSLSGRRRVGRGVGRRCSRARVCCCGPT